MPRTLVLLPALLCLAASALALPPAKGPSGKGRYLTGKLPLHEPRDRTFDITHMALSVRLDPANKSATGEVVYRGVVAAQPGPQSRLVLHAVDLDIQTASVTIAGRPGVAPTRAVDEELRLRLPGAKVGERFEARLAWTVRRPAMGLYFIAPDADEPKRPVHVWTQGETHGARHWLPSPDDPDERFTWEVSVTAPGKLVVLSNGRQVSRVVQRGVGTTRYRLDKPYPIYLLNLAAGPFKAARHPHKRVRIDSWADKRHIGRAGKIGQRTGQMLDLFEKLTGAAYPHKRYGHLYVDEFVAGGMENITLTTLTTRAVGTAATDRDRTIEGLLAHELAHQWFGDRVTCRTWADLWLNEGFATYYQKLWTRHAHGELRFAEEMAGARKAALGADSATPRPVVADRYRHPSELFDGHAYPKGAWVLHMLRESLGHAVFDRGIASYLKQHGFQSVETADLRRALERVSGRSLRGYFQRWLRQPGAPRVTAKLSWRRGRLRVRLRQTQRIDGQRPAYDLPVVVAVSSGGRVTRHHVQLRGRRASLDLPLKAAPDWAMVDPHMRLLVDWKLEADADLMRGAASHAPHADARLRAVLALRGQLHRDPVVRTLLEVLARDKARHVRGAAAKILGAAPRESVRAGLQRAAKKDPESLVRAAAVAALGQHRDAASRALLVRLARKDPSPRVKESALRAVFAIDRRASRPLLLEALRWPSWRHRLQGVALARLALLGDPRDLERIWAATKAGEPKSLRAQAATALAAYAVRVESAQEAVREHLESLLQEDSVRLRSRAVAALSTLSDPASRGALRAAAARETYFRLAERMRGAARGLGRKRSANKRLDRLEKALEKLERRGAAHLVDGKSGHGKHNHGHNHVHNAGGARGPKGGEQSKPGGGRQRRRGGERRKAGQR